MMDREQVEQLARLAAEIPARVRERYEQVEAWREELAALEGRRCTGRVTWRDKDREGQTPKMVIVHSVDGGCQVHGEPKKRGGRVRVYVGAEKEAQREARAALMLEQEGRELERRIRQLEGNLRSCEWELEGFYRVVGFRVVDGELVSTDFNG